MPITQSEKTALLKELEAERDAILNRIQTSGPTAANERSAQEITDAIRRENAAAASSAAKGSRPNSRPGSRRSQLPTERAGSRPAGPPRVSPATSPTASREQLPPAVASSASTAGTAAASSATAATALPNARSHAEREPSDASGAMTVDPEQITDIVLTCVSTWGDVKACSLDALEAFGTDTAELPIPAAALSCAQGGAHTIGRLLRRGPRWSVGLQRGTVAVRLMWPRSRGDISALRIVNDDGARAWRECRIAVNGELIAEEELAAGRSTLVRVLPEFDGAIPPESPVRAVQGALTQNNPSEGQVAPSASGQVTPRTDSRPSWLDSTPTRASARKSAQDDELLASIDALNRFSSSHSRRFFEASRSDTAWNRKKATDERGVRTSGGFFSQQKRAEVPGGAQELQNELHLGTLDLNLHTIEESPARADDSVALASPEDPRARGPGGVDAGSLRRDLAAEFAAEDGAAEEDAGAIAGAPREHGRGGPSAATSGALQEASSARSDALEELVPALRPATAVGRSLMALDKVEEEVEIPTMPRGRVLTLNLVSTWGDGDFVGLNGIEVFDQSGAIVVLKDVRSQVVADPPDINVLPEHSSDPRTVDKLFDQVNLTRDDLHVWLAPFTPGQSHTITIDLLGAGAAADDPGVSVAMLRIWNFNKSRLHASRGVRELEVFLDGAPIFRGEIRKAPGLVTNPEDCCEHILFTLDEAVLADIEARDWLPQLLNDDEPEDEAEPVEIAHEIPPARPSAEGRPLTAAVPSTFAGVRVRRCLRLRIHSTWGDRHYVGLTGLEPVGKHLDPVEVVRIDGSPKDINELENCSGDPRVLSNLLNGVVGTDDRNMWLAPFVRSTGNVVELFFAQPCELAGLHVWNYAKTVEDTARGAKEVSIEADDELIGTFIFRKAPGHFRYDFRQLVLFDALLSQRVPLEDAQKALTAHEPSNTTVVPVPQQYETPLLPSGFSVTLTIHRPWGDEHYVGLDRLQLIDARTMEDVAPRARLFSKHGSVAGLRGMEQDVRTEANLVSATGMWLAPHLGNEPNVIELVFDEPVEIALIRVDNYRRTPTRGASDIELSLDGLVVFQGVLRQGGTTSILFTDDAAVVAQEKPNLYVPTAEEVVQFFDGHTRVNVELDQQRPQTTLLEQK